MEVLTKKQKETINRITFEIAYNKRIGMMNLIRELSGDEYENIDAVFELAKKSKNQLRFELKNILDYLIENPQNENTF